MRFWLVIMAAAALAGVAHGGVAQGAVAPPIATPPVWQTLPPTPRLPAPARQGRVAVDGATIWYGQYGFQNRGTPVLLLHGGLANSDYFGLLVPALVRSGYRVIVMDSRGHGRSSPSTRPYSYALMARDVVGLLDHLGLRQVDLVGWSDGGIVGLELGLNAPSRVRRLYAFGTNASLDGLRPDYDKQPVFARYIERSAIESRAQGRSAAQHATFLGEISRMWASEPAFTPDQLARIAIPVTMALGQHDEAIARDHVVKIDSALPNSVIEVVPNVSHLAMIQQPAQFNASVIAFLRWR